MTVFCGQRTFNFLCIGLHLQYAYSDYSKYMLLFLLNLCKVTDDIYFTFFRRFSFCLLSRFTENGFLSKYTSSVRTRDTDVSVL